MNGFQTKKSPLPGRSPFSGESCLVLGVFFCFTDCHSSSANQAMPSLWGSYLVLLSHRIHWAGTSTYTYHRKYTIPHGSYWNRYRKICFQIFKPGHLLSPAEIGSHQILPCFCPRQAAKNAQVLCSQDVLPVSWLHMFCVFQKISCSPLFSITRYQRPKNLSVVFLQKKQMFTGFIPLPRSSFPLNQVWEASTELNSLNSSLNLSSSTSLVFVFVGDFLMDSTMGFITIKLTTILGNVFGFLSKHRTGSKSKKPIMAL